MTEMNVHQAISEVSRRVGGIAKDGFNEHQRYNFRGIDQLVTAVQPVLNEVGLTITPSVVEFSTQDRVTEKNIQRWCTVLVKYTLTGPNGDTTEALMVGEAADVADKAMNKALSNAAKYFYFQTFWFGIGGMDDGDFDHPEAAPRKTNAPAAQPQQYKASPKKFSGGATDEPSTEPQHKKIWAMTHKTLGWDDLQMMMHVHQILGDDSFMDLKPLTKGQASQVIESVQAIIDGQG